MGLLLAFELRVMAGLDTGASKVKVPPTVASVSELDAVIDPEPVNSRLPLLTNKLTKFDALMGWFKVNPVPLVKFADPTFNNVVVLREPEPLVAIVRFSPLGTD